MFNIALSGLNAATTGLDVISHNIANASSTGFKSSRALFADMYAATPAPTHPVGLGVCVAGVDQSFAQGSISETSNGLDMAIDGNGFFGVTDGSSTTYTRAGAFGTDSEGYIVNNAGQRLLGYQGNPSGGVTGQIGTLRIDKSSMPPTPTTSIEAELNLDADSYVPSAWPSEPFQFDGDGPDPDTYNGTMTMPIYDSLGSSHTLNLYFARREDDESLWDVHALIDGVTAVVDPPGNLSFDADGVLEAGSGNLTIAAWEPLDQSGQPNGAVGSPLSLSFDATQFGNTFSVHSQSQNGYASGEFSRIGIDASGTVTAFFSNDRSQALGQVALYNFTNPDGLQPLGNNAWAETTSSGSAIAGAPDAGGLGLIQSGALEESNVDLTAELANLILAQRNYQANAKTIQTADAVTQTIINLR
ncbi:flagellar hook-basal body protein [Thioflavicoccus mobilis 8321]|uniref:Flagellar hook protein FlgE n=1 Tax=Thioflavicoccus mobilis 8321 TaxID=765912 RepID=L0H291_9GAMM|nr:flagellar hook protein FlgE [Thioflavicoccus mobilis]AGA92162.1 flagellar hook-basal body protein [Thioflavicoccus mobilis 8321]